MGLMMDPTSKAAIANAFLQQHGCLLLLLFWCAWKVTVCEGYPRTARRYNQLSLKPSYNHAFISVTTGKHQPAGTMHAKAFTIAVFLLAGSSMTPAGAWSSKYKIGNKPLQACLCAAPNGHLRCGCLYQVALHRFFFRSFSRRVSMCVLQTACFPQLGASESNRYFAVPRRSTS